MAYHLFGNETLRTCVGACHTYGMLPFDAPYYLNSFGPDEESRYSGLEQHEQHEQRV